MNRSKNKRTLLGILLLCGSPGCTSITSTMLNRTETDDFVGNSNGRPSKHCQTRPYKGVPITLRVPTHVDVAILEKVRLVLNDDNLSVLQGDQRHLSVETNLIYTDKVFTVDVKRPAAGTSKYTMEFGGKTDDSDNRQYFKQLENKIVDETIKDVTGAINTIFEAVPKSKNGTEVKVGEPSLQFIDEVRTVAWKRFDVDEVDFESQVSAFVAQHLNDCHSCSGRVGTSYQTTSIAETPVDSSGMAQMPENTPYESFVPAMVKE